MVDESQIPMGESAPSVAQVLAYYEAGTDLRLGVSNAHDRTYELMRRYPEGVPSGVMLATAMRSIKWSTALLGNLMMEVAGEVRGEDEEWVLEQGRLTQAVLELMITHAQNTIIEMFSPLENEEGST